MTYDTVTCDLLLPAMTCVDSTDSDPVVARPGLSASVQLGTPSQLERRLRRELQSHGLVDDTDGPSAVADDQVSALRTRHRPP